VYRKKNSKTPTSSLSLRLKEIIKNNEAAGASSMESLLPLSTVFPLTFSSNSDNQNPRRDMLLGLRNSISITWLFWVLNGGLFEVSRVRGLETAEVMARTLARNFPDIEFKMYTPAVQEKKRLKNAKTTIKKTDTLAYGAKTSKRLVLGSTVRVVSGTFAEFVGSLKKLIRKTGKVSWSRDNRGHGLNTRGFHTHRHPTAAAISKGEKAARKRNKREQSRA
ncbi:hypothetical protein CCACVL1_21099, partial [Corchorus capsularis]